MFSTAALASKAEFYNHRRWLTFDLLCGRVDRHHPLWGALADGVPEHDLEFVLEHPLPPTCWVSTITSRATVSWMTGSSATPAGELIHETPCLLWMSRPPGVSVCLSGSTYRRDLERAQR